MKKYIKFVIFFICLFLTFTIYKLTTSKKINYLALGDSLSLGQTPFNTYNKSFTDYIYSYLHNKYKTVDFVKEFCNEDYRITDLINDIKYNKDIKINNITTNINQQIAISDIITISIGSEELFYKIKTGNIKDNKKMFLYVDEMFEDIKKLINLIRKTNNKPIIFIGYYYPIKNTTDEEQQALENIFNYINTKYNEIKEKKNVYYIDIHDEFNRKPYYLPSTKVLYPSLEGYNYISNKVIELIITNKLLK